MIAVSYQDKGVGLDPRKNSDLFWVPFLPLPRQCLLVYFSGADDPLDEEKFRTLTAAGIHAVATHPDHRHRGHCRRLLGEALAHAGRISETSQLMTELPRVFRPAGLRSVPQTCFVAEQAAEKALKAVHYARGERTVYGHSVRQLLQALAPGSAVAPELIEAAQVLDQYYIPTRYPNGLPGGVPYKAYTAEQAVRALGGARRIVEWARQRVRRDP
jgi:HEPN domain-containing protein